MHRRSRFARATLLICNNYRFHERENTVFLAFMKEINIPK
jgi:hypothetical protein